MADSQTTPESPHRYPAWIDERRWFMGLLLAVTAWKAFAAANLGLIFDECYYWAWSLHPQACYFDHPPLTAWLIASAHSLFGHTPMAVRFWALVSGVVLCVAGRLLAGEMFGPAAGNRAGILLLLAPIFAGNSLLMTPDTVLAPAWGLALLFAWRGSRTGAPMSWWLATGAAAGIGMLGKYTMVLFFAGLGLLWLTSAGKRKRLFLGGLMAGIVALMFFVPVIWWNSRHDWVSFAHQLNHGFRNEHRMLINFGNLADYAAFLVVLVSPVLGLLCFRSAATRRSDERFRYLAIFFWTVVLFFGFSAAKAHIEANWPMTAFISGLIMVAGDWNRYGRGWRKAALIVLLVADIAAVAGVVFLCLPKAWTNTVMTLRIETSCIRGFPGSEAIATEAGRGVAELQSRLSEFLGPQEAARAASEAFRESGADFLCADTYQFFGVLSFYAPETEPSLWLPETGRKRFPWVDEGAWNGKKALVAEWPRSGCNYAWLFARTVWTKKVALPGLTRPLTLTLVEGYDMKRVREK
jgi:hypothetical protein